MADSFCTHGDTPGAVAMAQAVRAALERAGVPIDTVRREPMTRRLLDYGAEAVLLECADLAEVRALRPAVAQEFDQVSEIVPGARTLLLRLQTPLTSADRQRLLTLAADRRTARSISTW